LDSADLQLELARMRAEVTSLNRTGMALMMERDHDALLRQILDAAMRLTVSDAGALYLMEKSDGTAQLRFKVAHSRSLAVLPQVEGIAFAVDSTTLVGHVATTMQPLVSEDVHNLPAGAKYQHNLFLEELADYRIKSMMTIPMVDHRDNVVGVLQLGNRKRDPLARIHTQADADQHVIPYSTWDTQIAYSLAGQAAVSIENASLYRQVEHLFDSFTKAAVTALEQRDPGTSGHSIRVAALVLDIARALERTETGPYRDLRFTRSQLRELRYAALLHDFGKVGVREEVLAKAKKVPPLLWERITARFDVIRYALKLKYAGRDAELRHHLEQVSLFESAIRTANEPGPLSDRWVTLLREASGQTFERPDGRIDPYLTADELHYLEIPQGSLDEQERREIEAHAQETLRFLSKIPWTPRLQNVAAYAAGHHERLNGTGYPMRLAGADIPVQMRIMAIADVFDALTAADRPYRRAVSADKALDILRAEAKAGALDGDIVGVLVESEAYRRVLDEDWARL
jgi:HD-GYP domain-containing protein (c-di-GMP phosphodiesterase class II)